jgi:hypothetical protein
MSDEPRAFGWWFLVPVVLIVSTVAAWVLGIGLLFYLEPIEIRWAVAARPSFPPSDLLRIADLPAIFLTIAIWIVPVGLALGFAIKTRRAFILLWSFSISLLLTATFVWFSREPFSRLFAVAAAALLVCGLIFLFARRNNIRALLVVNVAALGLLLAPRLIALASAANQPFLAHRVWAVSVPIGTGLAGGTETEVNLGEFLAFAGDRAIVVDAMLGGHVGDQPMSGYRLLSLDRNTGAIRNQMNVPGNWGDVPSVFGTKNGQVALVCADSISLLNPDLTATGIERKYNATGMWRKYSGKFSAISPDGTTLGLMTEQETTLLADDTLEPMLEIPRTSGSALITSVSLQAFLNVDIAQGRGAFNRKIPSAVNLVNKDGEHELFRDDCLPPGHFLTVNRILIAGCGKIRMLDTQGKMLKELRNAGTGGLFAGVSQNGNRFALQYSDERGDPSVMLYEQFIIYDGVTAKPIASVFVAPPERQSWSAFSPDGHFFAVGNPDKLTLYSVP